MLKGIANNRKIIHKYLNGVLHHIGEYRHHISLKSTQCITQPEGHFFEHESSIRKSKCGFLLMFRCNRDLVVARITIKKTIPPLSCKPIQHLIHEGNMKMVFLSPCIQFPVIHTHSLSDHRPHWNKLIFIIRDHNLSPFIRHTLNRAYLTCINDRIYDSDIQPLNNILLHYLLHKWI